MTKHEFTIYHRNTRLVAGPAIYATSLAAARAELRRQEGTAARAFEVRQA